MNSRLEQQGDSIRRQRLKISNACQPCRSRKIKCDGGRPACTRCQGRGKICTYNRGPVTTVQGKPSVRHVLLNRNHVTLPVSPSTSTTDTSWTESRRNPEHLDESQQPVPDQKHPYQNAHGRFVGEVTAAIDIRAGLTPATTSNLVPFVDAPLFGEVNLDFPDDALDFSYELPLRGHADRLVGVYWEHIHHVEPILSRKRFFHNYEASYSRPDASLYGDHDIWLSTLNAVLALAVQGQERIPRRQRDEEGNRYFQRAWALIRPGTILCKAGSLELVQCLMLLNRYLHCTNNEQKTWMTAGVALRMAQSMCFRLSENSSAEDSWEDRQLEQQVWASCVSLERCVSWALSRTSVPFLTFLSKGIDSMIPNETKRQGGGYADNFKWFLELHEIGNQIQLAQTQTRNSLAARLGLPRLYQHDDYHTVAVQLEACLNKWEQGLPSDWKLQNIQKIAGKVARAERYVLHLRILQTRIFLHRPILARFYTRKSHTSQYNPPSVSDRLLKDCASICIETAQKIVSLIIETLEPDEPIGLLPWWNRIYHLHVAATTFLAAMFGSDLFTESVSQSWQNVMSALRAHEHLSVYVQQCIQTFDTLSTRILGAQHPSSDENKDKLLEEENSGHNFDDIFQDLGFDFDDFLFGSEEIFGDHHDVDSYFSGAYQHPL